MTGRAGQRFPPSTVLLLITDFAEIARLPLAGRPFSQKGSFSRRPARLPLSSFAYGGATFSRVLICVDDVLLRSPVMRLGNYLTMRA